jgi:drug/metabolite transporter (DMT)-like permease
MGIVQLLISAVSFSFLNLLVKASAQFFTTFEIAFARSSINALIVFAVLKIQKESIVQTTNKALVLRALMGCLSMLLFFKSISVLSLSDAVVINATTPLFVTLILFLFARPKPDLKTIPFLALGFLGIILVAKPTVGHLDLNVGWGVASVICVSIAFIALHSLARSYSAEVITLYLTGLTTIVLIPTMWTFNWNQILERWYLLLGIGVTATVGQAFMTRAYARISITLATQLQQMTLVFSALLAWFYFNEVLDLQFFLGALLVVSASIGLVPLNKNSLYSFTVTGSKST